LKFQYGEGFLELEFPSNIEVNICKPIIAESENQIKDKMLFDVLKSKDWLNFLNDSFNKNSSILIIVNDATRATPTKFILEKILPKFKENNINYEFLIATGSHKAPTNEDLEIILGTSIFRSSSAIYCHDYESLDELLYCGDSPTFKTKVWVNKLLFEKKYDKIITINSVEPHYFGGWTGGRKSIIPGCAGKETITQTHKHALSPESKICRLEGNPVHDDFIECLNIVLEKLNKSVFSFQLLLDSKGIIAGVFGGTIFSSFEKCVNQAKNIFQVPTQDNYDLVILVLYPPLDQNFYQSHKAIENSRLVMSKNTSILLISPCNMGIGPEKFLEPLYSFYNEDISYKEFFQYIKTNYELGYHKSAKLVEISLKNKLYIKSEIKLDSTLSKIITPVNNINDYFNNLLAKNEYFKKVLVVLDAGVTVPIPN
jgi:nickel-dependent lactate racemase